MTNDKMNKVTLQIPEGVQVTIENSTLTITGEKGTITKTLTHPKIKYTQNNKTIEITCSSTRRKELALLGTFVAHIKNMIKGVSVGFEYHMKTVFSHFPIKTSVQDNKFIIENFLGERSPRTAKILENVTVEEGATLVRIPSALRTLPHALPLSTLLGGACLHSDGNRRRQ